MSGSFDGGVDAVRLAGEGDGVGRLGLVFDAVDLVVEGGVFEAGDLDGSDVLCEFRLAFITFLTIQ